MREIRLSGLEGGGTANCSPYPYVRLKAHLVGEVQVLPKST